MSLTEEIIVDGVVEPSDRKSIVKPYVMSHGTLECYSLKESRKFYEEFLGLECVRHAHAGDGDPLRPQVPHRLRRGGRHGAPAERAQPLGRRRRVEGEGRRGLPERARSTRTSTRSSRC